MRKDYFNKFSQFLFENISKSFLLSAIAVEHFYHTFSEDIYINLFD